MYCAHCGAALAAGSAFCPSCGTKVGAPAPQAPPYSPTAAPPVVVPAPAAPKRSPLLIIVIVIAGVFVGIIVLSIVAAIAVPGLLRARMTGNETSAMTQLSSLQIAQIAYATTCGKGGFAVSFGQLAEGDTSGASTTLAALASADHTGYSFTIGPGAGATDGPVDCHGRPTVTAWYATATPATFNTTGTRSFATNGSGEVWQNSMEIPPREPFGPPSSRVR